MRKKSAKLKKMYNTIDSEISLLDFDLIERGNWMAKLFKERSSKPIHRREFIRLVGIVTGFLILTACIPQPTQPSAIPTEKPPTKTFTPIQTVTPTQTPIPPTATATITPTPTETATKTPEPTKLPISACMSDFYKWETAPAPPGEWGPIDKEKFRSQIANLNHLIADSGIVEAQMKAAGITGKPFDQSVIVKSYLVLQ
jgi:hypothetical protein